MLIYFSSTVTTQLTLSVQVNFMAFRKTPLSGLGTVSLPLPTKDEDDDEEESFYVA
jgi:hypothetical protein